MPVLAPGSEALIVKANSPKARAVRDEKPRIRGKLPWFVALLLAAGGGGTQLAAPRPALAQGGVPAFTNASLKGTCGFTAASANVNRHNANLLKPVSSQGTLTFDGVSAVTGTVTINAAGKLAATTTSIGTYSVSADGRTGTIDFTAHGGALYAFVINGAVSEIRYINIGPVDPASGIVNFVTIALCKF
jgi:hypothetical protein